MGETPSRAAFFGVPKGKVGGVSAFVKVRE